MPKMSSRQSRGSSWVLDSSPATTFLGEKYIFEEALLKTPAVDSPSFGCIYRYQCCGSGMFYPGSGSQILSFRNLDPDPKSFHPGTRILLYIKRGMKNKSNLFLALYGFRSKSY
jgi:hypothetical protein